MVNKAIIVGNLGRDPEMQEIRGGQVVTKFSVATTRKWRDRDGERHEQTEWHNVVCWGRTAEVASQYLSKGRQVYVEGRLQTQSWEDKETGKKMYRTEIVADRLQMLGQRDSGDRRDSAPVGGGSDDSVEDIPF